MCSGENRPITKLDMKVNLRKKQLDYVTIIAVLALALCVIPYLQRYYYIYASRALDQPIEVSPLQLLANPDQYDGALVSVLAWCVIDFEHTSVQVTNDSGEWNLAIWLDIGGKGYDSMSAPSPTFCRVQGIFEQGWAGHMGRWPAQVSPVEDLVLYD